MFLLNTRHNLWQLGIVTRTTIVVIRMIVGMDTGKGENKVKFETGIETEVERGIESVMMATDKE